MPQYLRVWHFDGLHLSEVPAKDNVVPTKRSVGVSKILQVLLHFLQLGVFQE